MKKDNKPVKHFLIKHESGSKANQHEQFSFDKYDSLTFGRDESNDVRFDPEIIEKRKTYKKLYKATLNVFESKC